MASGADPSWGSAEGSAKAPLRFQQGGGSVFFRGRFHQDSVKVPLRFHQSYTMEGSTKLV